MRVRVAVLVTAAAAAAAAAAAGFSSVRMRVAVVAVLDLGVVGEVRGIATVLVTTPAYLRQKTGFCLV